MRSRSYNKVQISASALAQNFQLIQKRVDQSTPVMAMVKADGYGHGMIEAAQAFSRAGCTRFGVAEMREALELRECGIDNEIFVTIGFRHEEAELFFTHQLTPVIYDLESAKALSRCSGRFAKEIGVHLKIDSGMGRLGILIDEVEEFTDKLSSLKGIRLAGLMSHFPASDDPLSDTTRKNFDNYKKICETVKKRYGLTCHIANSGAVLNFPDTQCDMVRAGIALYGYHPAGPQGDDSSVALQPAMSFSTQVLQVKELAAGSGISYGHTYIAKNNMKIAVLPVGYEDGFRRALSNKGHVLINGKYAPICGRVCMNMCMVDVSDIDGVRAEDEVVLMGEQGSEKITAHDVAATLDTISYEVLCNFGNNNSRIYID